MKYYLSIFLVMTFTATAFAQDYEGRKKRRFSKEYEEKIESRKIAYISDKLDLNTEEAQAFWPLYNEMMAEKKSIRESEFKMKEQSDSAELNADDALNNIVRLEERKLEMLKGYVERIKRVIGAEKTLKYLRLERSFREEILGRFKEKMGKRNKIKESK